MAVWTSGRVRLFDKVPLWVSTWRFQKTKVRVIDDYFVFGYNDATSIPEKITLGSVDFVAVVLKLFISTLLINPFPVTLSDCTVLQGDVHPDWPPREGFTSWGCVTASNQHTIKELWSNSLNHLQSRQCGPH